MNTLKRGVFIILTSVLLMMLGCSTTQRISMKPTISDETSGETVLSLVGTKWHYVDDDWEYDIEFRTGGKLHSTHSNDKTPDNDTWEQQGMIVRFYFNNGFSTYEGKLSGDRLMFGTAKSSHGSWNWKATRIK